MLMSLMQQQITVLETLGLERSKRNMYKLVRGLDEENFKILVLGEFNRGKSTLINALLGQDILPSGGVPTTKYLTEIKWGELSRVPFAQLDSLKSVSDSEKTMFDDVKKYITEYEEQHSPKKSYERIELRLPLEFCRDSLITLIDSPGLGLLDNQEQMVTGLLSSVAVVIFVLAGDFALSTSEMHAIDFIRMCGHRDIFFVINRVDVIPPDELGRLQKYLLAKLHSFLGEETNHVFFVSALQALKGQLSNDQELFDNSGLSDVEKELKTFVAAVGEKELLVPATELQASVDEAQRTISEVTIVSKTSWKLTQKSSIRIEDRLKALEKERTSIVQFFEGFLAHIKDEILEAASDFCASVANKISDWVDGYELEAPMRLLETFSSSSQERVVEEVSHFITRKVERELDKWQESMLEPLLSQKLEALSQELNHRVQQFAHGLEEIHVKIITDLQPINSINTPQQKAFSISQLFPENLSMKSYLKSGMTNFTNTSVATAVPSLSASLVPAIAILLSFIIAPGITGGIIGSSIPIIASSASNMNKKFKDAVAQKYIKTFQASSNELANRIATNIAMRLHLLQESLDNTLDLEIKKLSDKINLILSEQQDQLHANKEHADFTGLSQELNRIKDALSTLLAQISLREGTS